MRWGVRGMNEHHVCQGSYHGTHQASQSHCEVGLKAQRGAGTCPCLYNSRGPLLTPHFTYPSICHEGTVSWPAMCSNYQHVSNEKSGSAWQEGGTPDQSERACTDSLNGN